MKKLFLTLIAGMFCITLTFAQQGERKMPSADEMAKREVQQLTKSLTLSETQQDSILNYLKSSSTDMRKIMEEAGDDREAAFAKMKAQRDQQTAKIKTYLTAEQVTKYEAYLKEREANRGQRRRPDSE